MSIYSAVCDYLFVTQTNGDIRGGERKTKKVFFLLYHILLFLISGKNKKRSVFMDFIKRSEC